MHGELSCHFLCVHHSIILCYRADAVALGISVTFDHLVCGSLLLAIVRVPERRYMHLQWNTKPLFQRGFVSVTFLQRIFLSIENVDDVYHAFGDSNGVI